MAKFNLTALDDRQVPIPDELLHPVSLADQKEFQNGPLSETRGAADSTVPFDAESNARWAAPAVVTDNRITDDD